MSLRDRIVGRAQVPGTDQEMRHALEALVADRVRARHRELLPLVDRALQCTSRSELNDALLDLRNALTTEAS